MLFLTKLFPVFFYPVGLSLLLVFIGSVSTALHFRRLGRLASTLAICLLWLASAPIFAENALFTLERQYPAVSVANSPKADAAIVLGGAVTQPIPPRIEAGLTEAADRILHAVRLYKAGKVRKIIVTGGNLPWLPGVKPEAMLIKELLEEWGVPADAIELGIKSRNTYENALEAKEIWDRQDLTSALLVTSASHMPRAMATFLRMGLPVTASTADVRTTSANLPENVLAWLPNAEALGKTTGALKEWLGLLAYRFLGYA